MLSVRELWIYPVKSCAGISLSEAVLHSSGLHGDRRYMVADAEGTFVTGRTEPRLLSVHTRFRDPRNPDSGYVLSVHGQQDLVLPYSLAAEDHEQRDARVWRDQLSAVVHESGSLWFQNYLGKQVFLLYQPESALRAVSPKHSQPGDVVSLADGYPLLLCSESSLADLNARLNRPVPMTRFRPNIVVSGAGAFAEDCWSRLSVQGLTFDAPKLCDRCVMTTIDPTQSIPSKEPLRTLSTYRRWEKAVWFGLNLIPREVGSISVGATVEVLEERNHPRHEPA